MLYMLYALYLFDLALRDIFVYKLFIIYIIYNYYINRFLIEFLNKQITLKKLIYWKNNLWNYDIENNNFSIIVLNM
jgi:hypothetical protein